MEWSFKAGYLEKNLEVFQSSDLGVLPHLDQSGHCAVPEAEFLQRLMKDIMNYTKYYLQNLGAYQPYIPFLMYISSHRNVVRRDFWHQVIESSLQSESGLSQSR